MRELLGLRVSQRLFDTGPYRGPQAAAGEVSSHCPIIISNDTLAIGGD